MNKILMYIITFWTLLFAVAFYTTQVNACVDCDLNKEAFSDIGVIQVSTGNENYEAINLKVNSEDVISEKVKERFLTPDGQWCFVTITIKEENNEIVKKEELHCADTKHGITKDQEIEKLKKQIELEKARKPGYWELFAEFYYRDQNAPLYCRQYAKSKGIFKKTGKVCLDPTGKWEVIN